MNSNAVTIRLSRNNEIEENIDVAKITLDNLYYHKQGQPVLVRYYKDPEKQIVDTLVAIGIKDGIGRNCYSLLTTSGELEVNGIYDRELTPPDVALLVNGAVYISRYNDVLSLVYKGNGDIRRVVPIDNTKEIIFRNLADGFRWFYINNTIRKETDILSQDQINELIDSSITITNPAKINITLINWSTINEEGSVPGSLPIFKIEVLDYKNRDITLDCDIEFYIGQEKQKFNYHSDSNVFTPEQERTETTTYTVKAKLNDVYIGTQDITIKFIKPSYFTKDSNNFGDGYLWDKETEPEHEITMNLNNEILIIKVPYELTKILDIHGLDYIDDYTKTIVNGYFVYTKLDRVTINNFKQIIS